MVMMKLVIQEHQTEFSLAFICLMCAMLLSIMVILKDLISSKCNVNQKEKKKKRLRCILLTESGTSIEASHHALMLYLIRVHIFILCTIIKI